jgi:hypothetical protein
MNYSTYHTSYGTRVITVLASPMRTRRINITTFVSDKHDVSGHAPQFLDLNPPQPYRLNLMHVRIDRCAAVVPQKQAFPSTPPLPIMTLNLQHHHFLSTLQHRKLNDHDMWYHLDKSWFDPIVKPDDTGADAAWVKVDPRGNSHVRKWKRPKTTDHWNGTLGSVYIKNCLIFLPMIVFPLIAGFWHPLQKNEQECHRTPRGENVCKHVGYYFGSGFLIPKYLFKLRSF